MNSDQKRNGHGLSPFLAVPFRNSETRSGLALTESVAKYHCFAMDCVLVFLLFIYPGSSAEKSLASARSHGNNARGRTPGSVTDFASLHTWQRWP